MMKKSATPFMIKAKRPPSVLVCGKCLKKCEEGKAIRKALKSELAERARTRGQRPGKLVDTKCMGLCPKQAAVVMSGTTLTRGELVLVNGAGQAAATLDLLFPGQTPSPGQLEPKTNGSGVGRLSLLPDP